jgi:hypothetical protein
MSVEKGNRLSGTRWLARTALPITVEHVTIRVTHHTLSVVLVLREAALIHTAVPIVERSVALLLPHVPCAL